MKIGTENSRKLTFELISYASKLAEKLNTSATALSIGFVENDQLVQLGRFGAKRVISISNEALRTLDNQTFTSVIAEMAQKENASVILLSNNNTGKAIAPRLSVRLKAGIGPGVSKLPESIDPFIIYKKVYSGNAFANVMIKSDIKILTLAQNSFELCETENTATIEK